MELAFPAPPEKEQLLGCGLSLSDSASYYIGAIQRYMQGDMIDIHFSQMEKLKIRFSRLDKSTLGQDDSQTYLALVIKLNALNALVEEVRKNMKKATG